MSETELPTGWAWSPLGDLVGFDGVFTDGDWVESKDQDPAGDVRLVQLADVGAGQFRDRSSRSMTSEKARELRCTYLEPGDVLVARMPEPLGRACIYPGGGRPAVTVVDVCVVRPGLGGVNNRWLMWAINSPQVREKISFFQTGTTRKRISRKNLEKVILAVPPLAEQQRIVEALEAHVSRLDSAILTLDVTAARAKSLVHYLMSTQFNSLGDGNQLRLDEVAEVRLGRQRSPKNHTGNQMRPYLRAANVGWDGLKLDDVKDMNFTDKELATYRLHRNDIVLSEASGSPGEVGKPAIWNDEIEDCCFQNTLIRIRPESINPLYLLYFLRCSALRGDFRDGARGVGIHHLGAAKLAAWKIPVPSEKEQLRIVETLDAHLSLLSAASSVFNGNRGVARMTEALRANLLRRAFTGALVPQDPTDEPATTLLARIRAERAAHPKRTRRAPVSRKAAAKTTGPVPCYTPTASVQQELPL